MPKFTKASALTAHIKKAMDALQAETLITTQARLGSAKVSPVDTGRFRSSWFAAEGSASSAVAPEGANAPNTDARGLRITSDREYHLTNNLSYAEIISIEGRVVSKPPTWFKDFREFTVPKIHEAAARTVKRRFDL